MTELLARLRGSRHPWVRRLKRARDRAAHASLPLPPALGTLMLAALAAAQAARALASWLAGVAWRKPLFLAHCAQSGRGLRLDRAPHVVGRPRIVLGDEVTFSGPVMITATGDAGAREIVFGDRCWIGHATSFQVAGRIEIGERAAIAAFCYVADNDAHARAFGLRLAGATPAGHEVLPVRIGRAAWIGRGCMILKGVTIGDGAVVGAGSVVTSDVPPFCVALGNPARVVRREPHPADGDASDQAMARELGLTGAS